MTSSTIRKMSESGAVDTLNTICVGLKDFVHNNPEAAKSLLVTLVEECLVPLAAEDFFGTEGWESALGLEE